MFTKFQKLTAAVISVLSGDPVPEGPTPEQVLISEVNLICDRIAGVEEGWNEKNGCAWSVYFDSKQRKILSSPCCIRPNVAAEVSEYLKKRNLFTTRPELSDASGIYYWTLVE